MGDRLDGDVYTNTVQIRRMYVAACKRLGIKPRTLTNVTIGMRSTPPPTGAYVAATRSTAMTARGDNCDGLNA